MNGNIIAEHLANISEKFGPLSFQLVKKSLKNIERPSTEKSMQCCFNINSEKFLEIRFVNSGRPCEQFDLRLITNVAAFSSQKSSSENPYLLVFRYLAKQLTDGSSFNEFHVFKLNSESDLILAVSSLKSEIDAIRTSSVIKNPQRRLLREKLQIRNSSVIGSARTSTNSKNKSMSQIEKKEILKRTNTLLETIQEFENKLKIILKEENIYETTGDPHSETKLRKEDAADHIKYIREGLNTLPELIGIVDKVKIGKIARKFIISLRWIRSVGESKKIRQIHPLLIGYVKEPILTQEAVQLFDSYLRETDRVFFASLGESWSIQHQESFEKKSEKFDMESNASLSTLVPFSRRATGDELFKEITSILPNSNPKTEIQPKSQTTMEGQPYSISSFHASFTEENFINSIRHRGKLVAKIVQSHEGKDRAELSVKVGDILEVLDFGEHWCCLRTSMAVAGHVPIACVQILADEIGSNDSSVSKFSYPKKSESHVSSGKLNTNVITHDRESIAL